MQQTLSDFLKINIIGLTSIFYRRPHPGTTIPTDFTADINVFSHQIELIFNAERKMSCYLLSSLERILQPCGLRCTDIKSLLLSQSNCKDPSELQILQELMEYLYFTEKPETEGRHLKKCIIAAENGIFSSEEISLYVLQHGDNNLPIDRLLRKSVNFDCSATRDFGKLRERSYAEFGKISVTFIGYNKCFCDRCIGLHLFSVLQWVGATYRVYVFKDFLISICEFHLHDLFTRGRPNKVLPMIQYSIKALLTTIYFKCCYIDLNRRHALWLADGDTPLECVCELSNSHPTLWSLDSDPRRNYNRDSIQYEILNWAEIPNDKTYLVVGVKESRLYLVGKEGYNILVHDYPKFIERRFNESLIIFIQRTEDDAEEDITNVCVQCYDCDYQEESCAIYICAESNTSNIQFQCEEPEYCVNDYECSIS